MTTSRTVPTKLLKGDNLPSLPTVAVQVLSLCRREDTTLDDLAEVIAHDPALSVKLLRYANSSLFNLGSEVTTLQRATLVLGMKSVQLMSLSFSLVGNLPRRGKEFDYDGFWRRSLALAVAARLLCLVSGKPGEDEAFLCGLLGDIGQLVMVKGGIGYEAVVEAVGERWPTPADEALQLGYHRGDVARELLGSWKLPDVVNLGVGYMSAPEELPSDTPPSLRDIVDVLAIARYAVAALCDGSGEALAELEERARITFALSPNHVRTYLLSLESAFREAAELLDLPVPTTRSHEEIIAEARSAMLNVGLEATGELNSSKRQPDLGHRGVIPEDDALRDPVTGLIGADGFTRYLAAEVHARSLADLPTAAGLLLIEIDGFTALEKAGPEALREAQRALATVLLRMTRRNDMPVHISARRFGVLLPECSAFGLRTLADRVLLGVNQLTGGDAQTKLSVTIGGACMGRATRSSDAEALVTVAERYLERGSARGGNTAQVHASVINSEAKAA